MNVKCKDVLRPVEAVRTDLEIRSTVKRKLACTQGSPLLKKSSEIRQRVIVDYFQVAVRHSYGL